MKAQEVGFQYIKKDDLAEFLTFSEKWDVYHKIEYPLLPFDCFGVVLSIFHKLEEGKMTRYC